MRGDKKHQRESLLYQNAMRDQEEKHTPLRGEGKGGMKPDSFSEKWTVNHVELQ